MNILTQKTYPSYNYISRYSMCPTYYHTLDDKYIMSTARQLSDQTLYSDYVVKRNDTYDKIALRFYNNPTYYWIICSFNRINDPFDAPIPGSTLKIPMLSNIEFL